MKQTFTVQSASGERTITVEYTPCNGDPSYVSYQLFNDGVQMGGGVVKPADMKKRVTQWAKSMLVDVTSVKQA